MSQWNNNNRINNDRCILAMGAARMKPRTILTALAGKNIHTTEKYIEAILERGVVEGLGKKAFGYKALKQNIAAHKAMERILGEVTPPDVGTSTPGGGCADGEPGSMGLPSTRGV